MDIQEIIERETEILDQYWEEVFSDLLFEDQEDQEEDQEAEEE